MQKNRHKPAAMKADDEYILTTKLFCGRCGTMMVGTAGTSRASKVYHYYKCGNNLYKKSCDKKAVRKDWIEHHVVSLTHGIVLQDDVIGKLAEAVVKLQKQENTTVPLLEKQLGDVVKRIRNVLNSIEEGIATHSVKEWLTELEDMKEEIEIALTKEKISKAPLTKK